MGASTQDTISWLLGVRPAQAAEAAPPEPAGIGIVQGLGNFFEVGSLGHDKFFLDGQGQRQTPGGDASGGLAGA